MHDDPVLADSNVIFTGTAGGIAWTTTGWNGGDPVWQYGATAAGAAFFNTLAANRIVADWMQTGVLQSADGSTFYLDLDHGVLRMNVTSLELNGTSVDDAISGAADAAVAGVQGQVTTLTTHILVDGSGNMSFVADNSPFSLRIDNDSLDILNGDTVIGSFAADGTTTDSLTTNNLTIPPYKFISRSNGHLQLVFVGS